MGSQFDFLRTFINFIILIKTLLTMNTIIKHNICLQNQRWFGYVMQNEFGK